LKYFVFIIYHYKDTNKFCKNRSFKPFSLQKYQAILLPKLKLFIDAGTLLATSECVISLDFNELLSVRYIVSIALQSYTFFTKNEQNTQLFIVHPNEWNMIPPVEQIGSQNLRKL